MQNTMWEIIERMCRQESSRQVLHALLSTTLVRLAGSNPDRVVELTKSIYDRVTNGLGVEGVRAACVNIFVGLYLWQDVSSCREITLRIASSPLDNIKAAHNLLPHLRDPLAHGPTDPPDSNDDAVRHRALDLLKCLLSSARRAFQHLEEDHSQIPFDAWSEQDKVRIRSIAQLIDGIGREVYFASGAYDKERQVPNLTAMHTPQQMERFYHETAEILDELADSGFASITHHLMGMLEAFVPLDPRGVFLRIGQVLRAGQKGGYQYESLAIDQLVRLVERYFAEYRRLLQQDSECRETLIKILDIFISAGWPNAQRLSYRLDDIFH
jgi:hypothetical protein